MTVASDNRPEIRPLTGIRGFAAGLVLLTHFLPLWSMLLPSLKFLSRLSGRGFLGVDLFFILSGFILNYVYFNPAKSRLGWPAYRAFLFHRFIRVWPVHFATIALLVAMLLAAHGLSFTITGKYPPSALPFQLAMTHAWLGMPGANQADPCGAWAWNYPSWSISAEWFAYVFAFPVLWQVLKRFRAGEYGSFSLCYLSMALWALVIWPKDIRWGNAIVMVTLEFMAGAWLYNAWRSAGVITRVCQRLATLTFLLIVSALLFCPMDTPMFDSFLILLFPVLLLGLTAETALLAKLFATPPALWLGRVSYSLYMTQALAQKTLKGLDWHRYAQSPLGWRLLLAAGTLIFILAFASIFYYFVETPARSYLRKAVEGRAGRQPVHLA